jgi:hypothetical protein
VRVYIDHGPLHDRGSGPKSADNSVKITVVIEVLHDIGDDEGGRKRQEPHAGCRPPPTGVDGRPPDGERAAGRDDLTVAEAGDQATG